LNLAVDLQSFNPVAAEYPKYVGNILACLEVCRAHDNGQPVRRCIHNQRTIQENAIANDCPHPQQNQFLIELKLPALKDGYTPPAPQPDWWSIAGPLLWKELHRWALSAHLQVDQREWLKNFTNKIACGECKTHWLQWTARNPPDFTSHEALFIWSVNAHNSVNERLGKPTMTVEDARRRWSRPDTPAASPRPAPHPCRAC
jgi:hypothetical protein